MVKKKEKHDIRQEVSAGGIVFKRTPQGVRIGFIFDPYKKWTFAKGHIEKGETAKEAALRETHEEMGLPKLQVIKYLGNIDLWFRDRFVHKGALIHKKVYYYLMKAPTSAVARPQKKEKITQVRWIGSSKALKFLGYKNAKDILARALAIIAKNRMQKEGEV